MQTQSIASPVCAPSTAGFMRIVAFIRVLLASLKTFTSPKGSTTRLLANWGIMFTLGYVTG